MTRQPGVLSSPLLGGLLFSVLKGWSLTFCSLLTDEEMMATEVAPSTMTELTDLGKCLMKHEVGGGDRGGFSAFQVWRQLPLFSTYDAIKEFFG